MLILTRKKGQAFFLGDDIKITIHDVGGDSARIAIEAPKNVRILREELVAETKEANAAAAAQQTVKPESIAGMQNLLKAKK